MTLPEEPVGDFPREAPHLWGVDKDPQPVRTSSFRNIVWIILTILIILSLIVPWIAPYLIPRKPLFDLDILAHLFSTLPI